MVDLDELERLHKAVPAGTWEVDSERQDDAPYRHLEYVLLAPGPDGAGMRMCGTENSDYSFGLIESEYDENGEHCWNEPSRQLMTYLAALHNACDDGLLERLREADEMIDNLKMQLGDPEGVIAHADVIIATADAADARAEAAETSLAALKAENERLRSALVSAEDALSRVEETPAADHDYQSEIVALGSKVGFGATMRVTETAWREWLRRQGHPVGGEFVAGPCRATVTALLVKIRTALETTNG